MTDDTNTVTPDNSRVLMSEALKDLLPKDMVDAATVADIAQGFVIAIVGLVYANKEEPLTGVLVSFMFADGELEVEANIQLEEGMKLLKSTQPLRATFVELHSGDDITRFEPETGAYRVAGARLGAIDAHRRMCTVLLNLRLSA